MPERRKVFLVAAERSGDALGAGLIRALRDRFGDDVEFSGVGGSEMTAEGLNSPFDISELSVLGFFEVLSAYPRVVRRADETADLAERVKPDVAVLIDSWGFTLRVAQRLKARIPDMPVVKYVGPQVWATRKGRAKTLAETVDRLLTIHSFDAPIFEAAGLPTTFVGNPTLEKDIRGDGMAFRERHGIAPDAPCLGVLFGSRMGELTRLADPFSAALEKLKTRYPDLRVIIPLAAPVAGAARERMAADPNFAGAVIVDEAEKRDAFAALDVALACSGTVTTELAMAGVPTVAGYRLGWATWALLRGLLFKGTYITLVNIAAGKELMPERIQTTCTGPRLAADISHFLDDTDLRARTSKALVETTATMRGDGQAAAKAAAAVAEYL
ncbi:lipid-A-disaccharide synthase [Hyphobacterium marinum]|uniref:Lipid-A-disaccharide synthase n=1 Tax=Hyphobacterium marinum TaxID=3116574 RepID=A0ABU7M2N6_9PROT|nr:lipid-A-disaccharide synthase [Hyphobacterium sp. Y6023]MEE2567525.1 lipid-A-disaccharide synthase [Hyphobacterium sp. Y6023]